MVWGEDSWMAMFVHLAPESRVALIRRNGIRRLRRASGNFPSGVFAVPVTRNFYVSHQWLRELKRRNEGPITAVYFRVPDDERVWVGHYNQAHRWLRASEAVGEFMEAEDARRLGSRHSAAYRGQRDTQDSAHSPVIGWRFSPSAKGKPPFCTCRFCIRGEYGARRLRKRLGTPDA